MAGRTYATDSYVFHFFFVLMADSPTESTRITYVIKFTEISDFIKIKVIIINIILFYLYFNESSSSV